MTASTPGFPTWVDLGTADLGGAQRFYAGLFGWQVVEEEYGGYTTFFLNGLPVAGAGPLFDASQPTAWSTYIATDDADESAARVRAAGGTVLVEPFDVLDQGRMAACLDPDGAPFSVWEAGTMRGSGLFDVPGSLTWNELNTRNLDGASAFYQAVFGWSFRNSSMGDQPYLVAKLGDTALCGLQAMDRTWPPDLPSHWMVYFAVHDCDESAEHALALGGRLIREPTALPVGRFAVIEDPQGGAFAILANNR
jgi:uncharacterized protein